jgi:hypothetical protein
MAEETIATLGRTTPLVGAATCSVGHLFVGMPAWIWLLNESVAGVRAAARR